MSSRDVVANKEATDNLGLCTGLEQQAGLQSDQVPTSVFEPVSS
jgi:hypothetical protein